MPVILDSSGMEIFCCLIISNNLSLIVISVPVLLRHTLIVCICQQYHIMYVSATAIPSKKPAERTSPPAIIPERIR